MSKMVPKITIIGTKSVIKELKKELKKQLPNSRESRYVFRIPSQKRGCDIRLVIDKLFEDEDDEDVHDVFEELTMEEQKYPIVLLKTRDSLSKLRTLFLDSTCSFIGVEPPIPPTIINVYWKDDDTDDENKFRANPIVKILPELRKIMKEKNW